jgi:hypothetical protein
MKKIVIAVVSVFSVTSVSAMQNLKLGGLAIHPVASVQEQYDSNIYLSRDAVKSSLINRSSAGFGFLNTEGARLSLKGGYAVEILSYDRAYRTNNAVHHNAALELGYKLSGDRNISAAENYLATTDPANSENFSRAKRVSNVARAAFEAPLKGQFGYSIDVQHTINDYLSSKYDMLDRAEILAGAAVDYKLQPKTKVFAAYHYGSLRYDKPNLTTDVRTNDAIYNNIDLGVTGDLTAKLTGTVTGGVQYRNYDAGLNNAADKQTTGGYGLRLTWTPVKQTEVLLYGKRANIESIYLDSRYYISTLNYLGVTREMNKFKAGVGFAYEAVGYPEETPGANAKRHDGNTNATANLDYNVQKWLTAGVGYAYKTRVSNERINNFVDNVISLQIKGMF